MTDALTRLLDGVIDYAGLFPPAKLSMSDSVEAYLRYRNGPEAWIMDRFACSSARLAEMASELKNREIETPIPITVIGQAAASHGDWGDALIHDAEAMTRFMEMTGDKTDIEALEIRVPGHDHLATYLRDLRSFNQIEVFCELPPSEAMPESLGEIAEQEWLGAKLRTGGLDASAFPTSDALAGFLQQCIQLELEFKLTAGLHHPFRHFNPSVDGKMHGFVNVLAASALVEAHDLSKKEVAEILECEDAKSFVFDSQGLGFRDWRASLEEIDACRALFAGFGSCSISEPLDDLQAAGLLIS